MDKLKELMGDAYKEGMTLEEVNSFFVGKNFADLSTGNYVDKNKYESTVKSLNDKLTNANNELNGKLTDAEKLKKEQEAKDSRIEQLEQLLKQNTLNSNKTSINGVLTSTRETLGIADNDKDFLGFIDSITSEDSAKSIGVANYVSKVVKDAYEKGKQDATKNAMGDFGKGNGPQGTGSDDKIGEIGKRLAGLSNNTKTFDYFK